MDNTRLFEQAYRASLTDEDFKRLAAIIERESGIKMPPEKKVMLQNRLKKRLYQLDMQDFKTYSDFVSHPQKGKHEVLYLLNFISTNKTDFFREAQHFSYLENEILPALLKQKTFLKIWSAGCASGEEVYSLAILMQEVRHEYNFDFSILGTDISDPVLKKARKAVYHEKDITDIPLNIRKKYFLRNKNPQMPLVRIIPEIRKKASFRYLNFMTESYELPHQFDIVFFRNVLIYFHKEVQYKVLTKILNNLATGGYLFIGHAENVLGFQLPLKKAGPNIFQKIAI
ncbi:MAG: CheR family methyltransferase [Bacteroidota bacterium]